MDSPSDPVCPRCGYNLRGLPLEGRCPECGTPIAVSMRGDLLRYADRDWLDRVRFGLLLKVLVVLVGIPLVAATAWGRGSGAPSHIMQVLVLTVGLFNLVAFFCISAPEHPRVSAEKMFSLRPLIRIFAVSAFVGEQIWQAGFFSMDSLGALLSYVLSLSLLPAYIALILYLRRLALRMRSERLGRQMTINLWGLGILNGITSVSGLDVMIAWYIGGGPLLPELSRAGEMLLMALFVVFNIWLTILLIVYYLAFRRALAERDGRAQA